MPKGTYRLLKKTDSDISYEEYYYEVSPPIEGYSLIGILGLAVTYGVYVGIQEGEDYRRGEGLWPPVLKQQFKKPLRNYGKH